MTQPFRTGINKEEDRQEIMINNNPPPPPPKSVHRGSIEKDVDLELLWIKCQRVLKVENSMKNYGELLFGRKSD